MSEMQVTSTESRIRKALCQLRLKKLDDAKKMIKEVIDKINNIQSDRTRHRFQKILMERIEEECILAELIGRRATSCQ